MAGLLDVHLGSFRLESPSRVAVFLALFPMLFAACVLFVLVSGILVFPAALAWFIYIAAQDELDLFSFPIALESVVEDIAAFAGLKQQSILIIIDSEDDHYCPILLRTKTIYPRCESFISDFNEPEEDMLNRGNPRKNYYLDSPPAAVSKITTDSPHRANSYSLLPAGAGGCSVSSNISQPTSPAPSYHSAASTMSMKGVLKTPERTLFDLSRRIVSPHWSVGRPINKGGTPSPLELSPEHEYPDSYVPSPKRWPSPASDAGSVTCRGEALRARPQETPALENDEANERMFVADGVGNTHLYERDASTNLDKNSIQHIDPLSSDFKLSNIPLKLERRLFSSTPEDKRPGTPPSEDSICKKMHDSLVKYNNETSLTIGWCHRYKDLIIELKGSLVKQDSEDEDQAKLENFNPITDIDSHGMDIPCLEPVDRPRLNKLQRWGLVHTYSKANLKDGIKEERGRREPALKSSEYPSPEISPFTLKEDYNFGNQKSPLEMRGVQYDSDDSEYYKSYWDGFDESYSFRETKSPESQSDEEEKWKITIGKWAEKGVEVMRPVNEEGRENFDGGAPGSPSSTKAVHWSTPLSDPSEREPLLRHDSRDDEKFHGSYRLSHAESRALRTPSPLIPLLLHGSPAIDDENINGSYRLRHIESRTLRTPSPLLPFLEEKPDHREEKTKESTPLGEASNRLFGRRLARAARLPAVSSPIFTTPPRPLPEKLIRMFEDLSKPQPTSPRGSMNSSPERSNLSPERNHPPPDGSEEFHGNETKGLGLDLGVIGPTTPSRETRRKSVPGAKGGDDGLSECF